MVALLTSVGIVRGMVVEFVDSKEVHLSRVPAVESQWRRRRVKPNLSGLIDCKALNLRVSDCASQYTPNARSSGN